VDSKFFQRQKLGKLLRTYHPTVKRL